MEDDKYSTLYAYLTTSHLPTSLSPVETSSLRRRARDFAVENGTLFWTKKAAGRNEWKAVVRASDALALARTTHSEFGGHEAARLGAKRLQLSFYLGSSLHSICERVYEECAVCMQKRESLRRDQVLHPIATSYPFERLGIDFIGPFSPTPRGNLYVLLLIDHFTKWVTAVPTPNKESATVAHVILTEIFPNHGAPAILQSDCGSEFVNALIRSLSSNTAFRNTSAYHPQANGCAERGNQTLLVKIGKLANDEKNDWDLLVLPLVYTNRTAHHSAIGMSPFRALYGRDPLHPLAPSTAPRQNAGGEVTSAQVAAFSRSLLDVRKLVDHSLKRSHDAMKKKHDASLRPSKRARVFEVGCLVELRSVVARKLEKGGWTGPFKVLVASKGSYRLEGVRDARISGERLRLFVPGARAEAIHSSASLIASTFPRPSLLDEDVSSE